MGELIQLRITGGLLLLTFTRRSLQFPHPWRDFVWKRRFLGFWIEIEIEGSSILVWVGWGLERVVSWFVRGWLVVVMSGVE
jgi:hypothetical protein